MTHLINVPLYGDITTKKAGGEKSWNIVIVEQYYTNMPIILTCVKPDAFRSSAGDRVP